MKKTKYLTLLFVPILLAGCGQTSAPSTESSPTSTIEPSTSVEPEEKPKQKEVTPEEASAISQAIYNNAEHGTLSATMPDEFTIIYESSSGMSIETSKTSGKYQSGSIEGFKNIYSKEQKICYFENTFTEHDGSDLESYSFYGWILMEGDALSCYSVSVIDDVPLYSYESTDEISIEDYVNGDFCDLNGEKTLHFFNTNELVFGKTTEGIGVDLGFDVHVTSYDSYYGSDNEQSVQCEENTYAAGENVQVEADELHDYIFNADVHEFVSVNIEDDILKSFNVDKVATLTSLESSVEASEFVCESYSFEEKFSEIPELDKTLWKTL